MEVNTGVKKIRGSVLSGILTNINSLTMKRKQVAYFKISMSKKMHLHTGFINVSLGLAYSVLFIISSENFDICHIFQVSVSCFSY